MKSRGGPALIPVAATKTRTRFHMVTTTPLHSTPLHSTPAMDVARVPASVRRQHPSPRRPLLVVTASPSTRLDSTRLDSTRLDSTRLDSTRPLPHQEGASCLPACLLACLLMSESESSVHLIIQPHLCHRSSSSCAIETHFRSRTALKLSHFEDVSAFGRPAPLRAIRSRPQLKPCPARCTHLSTRAPRAPRHLYHHPPNHPLPLVARVKLLAYDHFTIMSYPTRPSTRVCRPIPRPGAASTASQAPSVSFPSHPLLRASEHRHCHCGS
ncbi:hypothetical protein BKA80DRAFT_69248 [Phyllosticta citrichinensis]